MGEPDAKRSKSDEEGNGIGKEKKEGNQKQTKENAKQTEPPKDYIHVRARRGEATDSHSLAERVCQLHSVALLSIPFGYSFSYSCCMGISGQKRKDQ